MAPSSPPPSRALAHTRSHLSRMRAFPCRLFETHPEVKPLFSFFKEDSEVSGDNAGMRKHGLTVMETVNVAVEHIRNSTLGELAEDLFDLGVVHHTLQVNIAEQHFAVSARSAVSFTALTHAA